MGTLAFIGVVAVACCYILPEERRKKLFTKKIPYVIPADQIDEEDLKDYNEFYNN